MSCSINLYIPQDYKDIFPLFFSSFLVLSFTFRSMTHVYLILCMEWKRCEVFFFCPQENPFVPAMCLKRLPFSHWSDLVPWSKINWLHMCGSISGCTVLLHIYICLSLGQYLIIVALQLLFKIVLAILYQLHFQINSRITWQFLQKRLLEFW